MYQIFEILLIGVLIVIQSIFGVGLLLFGTPSFLLLGYDFANTINILMPVSIAISSLQFFKSKIRDTKFIKEYNLYCLPFLIVFLIIALEFKDFFEIYSNYFLCHMKYTSQFRFQHIIFFCLIYPTLKL